MLVFACIIYWLDRYEKEPLKILILVFLWGSLIAASIAFVLNTILGTVVFWLSNSEAATNFSVASIFAPVVEEVSKGIVVFLIFLFARKEFDSGLDGIVYAAIVGLGFAATENFYYILTMGFQESGLIGILKMAVIRIGLVGWQHPFYTAFIGLGFSIARLSKKTPIKFLAPIGGLAIAILTHAFHNTVSPFLIQQAGTLGMLRASFFDWIGWSAIGILIFFLIKQEQQRIRQYLFSEIDTGTITSEQYPYTYQKHQQKLILRSMRKLCPNNLPRTITFFQLAAELTHKLRQFEVYGEESGNGEAIMATRNSLKNISKTIAPYF